MGDISCLADSLDLSNNEPTNQPSHGLFFFSFFYFFYFCLLFYFCQFQWKKKKNKKNEKNKKTPGITISCDIVYHCSTAATTVDAFPPVLDSMCNQLRGLELGLFPFKYAKTRGNMLFFFVKCLSSVT